MNEKVDEDIPLESSFTKVHFGDGCEAICLKRMDVYDPLKGKWYVDMVLLPDQKMVDYHQMEDELDERRLIKCRFIKEFVISKCDDEAMRTVEVLTDYRGRKTRFMEETIFSSVKHLKQAREEIQALELENSMLFQKFIDARKNPQKFFAESANFFRQLNIPKTVIVDREQTSNQQPAMYAGEMKVD